MTRFRHSSKVQRWLAACSALVLVAMAVLIPAATVRAAALTDPVLVWNANAIAVIQGPNPPPVTTPPTPPGLGNAPPLSPLHLAMVHGAIYDAVNAIDKGHKAYNSGLSAPSSASQAAAVAQAAHDVLIGITPAALTAVKDRIDAMLTTSLTPIADSPAKTAGILIGQQSAAAMLLRRANDGRFDVEPFPVNNVDAGKWRPVPPLSNNVLGQFATVTPLTMKSPDQFRTAGPLDLASPEYAAEFNEVKALGGQTGSSRTAAQTMLAGFVGANPVPYMNQGLRNIAVAKGLSTPAQALLFVKTSMASADALIGCWNDKAHYLVWRPQTAIHEALNDGNPLTSPNADWTSLFATPGYPDHPSGYNCYTAGVWQSARLFFGTDKVSFTLTSPGVPMNAAAGNPVGVAGSTRSYHRFTGVIRDTIEGRILTGFHFRTPDVQGAWIGKKAAQWLDKHFFAPVP
jgi:hypothetical protein